MKTFPRHGEVDRTVDQSIWTLSSIYSQGGPSGGAMCCMGQRWVKVQGCGQGEKFQVWSSHLLSRLVRGDRVQIIDKAKNGS